MVRKTQRENCQERESPILAEKCGTVMAEQKNREG